MTATVSSDTMSAAQARKYFREIFGGEPDVIGSAPGRVNLIGEHTDYNGGQVLPIAIDRRTYVAMRATPRASGSRVVSDRESTTAKFDIHRVTQSGNWWDYVSGVCRAIEMGGVRLPQIEAVVLSSVPSASGLASSAALELATAVCLGSLIGDIRRSKELALLAWRVETQFVGVPCGVMDQFASALCLEGHALHLWCDTLETEQVVMREAVLIFDTGVPRSLRASEFNQRRKECEEALAFLRRSNPSLPNLAAAEPGAVQAARLPSTLSKRAMHVTEENRRVDQIVEHLMRSGTIPGELLYDSHASLRNNYECSTEELDWFVDEVREKSGVAGARLTGAGWGGCAIAVGDPAALSQAAEELSPKYQTRFGRAPRTWLTRADEGARIEDLTARS
jgi:galactokinase